MKRKVMLLVIIVLVVLVVIYTFPSNQTKDVIVNESKNIKPMSYTGISMMYETDEGSGEYVASEETNWLGNGYYFNSELSSCENGGILTWNDANKTVKLSSNKSDKCYVYFDKAPKIEVLSVELQKSNRENYEYYDNEGLHIKTLIKNNTDSIVELDSFINPDSNVSPSYIGALVDGDVIAPVPLPANSEKTIIFSFSLSATIRDALFFPIFNITAREIGFKKSYTLPEISIISLSSVDGGDEPAPTD